MKPLTKEFLINRKKCCGNGCKNCPYIPKHKKGSDQIEKNITKGRLCETALTTVLKTDGCENIGDRHLILPPKQN